MFDESLRRIAGTLVTLVALFLPATAMAQVDRLTPVNDGETGNYLSATPTEISEISTDELLHSLERAEARLSVLEAEQAQWGLIQANSTMVAASAAELNKPAAAEPPKPKKWFEKYSLRGYAQFRTNETLRLFSDSAPAQHVGDGSIGEDQTFLIRRARLIISGDATDNIAFYLQPDFATAVPGSADANQFVQIRDWYADIHLDDAKEYRFRVGQSKVPYGWENLQSSQNRLPLDRSDALNSAVKNERDLGAFFYWTPENVQDTFKFIMDEGLKGSGNYGVFGIGVYSGQGGSFREQNDNLHLVTRLTYPFTLDNDQIVEFGVQGYTGKYTVLSSAISPLGVGAAVRPNGTLETGNIRGIRDERVAATVVYYPQPWGFQAEWNVGNGPGLNNAQTEVIERSLRGGYLMTMYRHKTDCHGEFFPFARYVYYEGGYKSERNAPYVDINEWELGLEWQVNKSLELVGMYTLTDRTNTRSISTADTLSYEQFRGDLLRFQLQVNY